MLTAATSLQGSTDDSVISFPTMLLIVITQDPDVFVNACFTLQYLWRINVWNYFGYCLLWGATKFCNYFHRCCLHQPCYRFHNQWGVMHPLTLWYFLCWLFHLHLIYYKTYNQWGVLNITKPLFIKRKIPQALYVQINQKGLPLAYWVRNENRFLSLTAFAKAPNLVVSLVSYFT